MTRVIAADLWIYYERLADRAGWYRRARAACTCRQDRIVLCRCGAAQLPHPLAPTLGAR